MGWVATGLTDEALSDLTEMFKDLIVVEKGMEVELKPAVIFEVAYEEIQKSPNYSSGFALRFPRLVTVRDDKSLEEADTIERVVSLQSAERQKLLCLNFRVLILARNGLNGERRYREDDIQEAGRAEG